MGVHAPCPPLKVTLSSSTIPHATKRLLAIHPLITAFVERQPIRSLGTALLVKPTRPTPRANVDLAESTRLLQIQSVVACQVFVPAGGALLCCLSRRSAWEAFLTCTPRASRGNDTAPGVGTRCLGNTAVAWRRCGECEPGARVCPSFSALRGCHSPQACGISTSPAPMGSSLFRPRRAHWSSPS